MKPLRSTAEITGKILLIRLGAIGDVILTMPVADAVRRSLPGSRIDYLVKKEYQDLVAGHPGIGTVWAFDRKEGFSGLRRLTAMIRRERYDLVVDLHSNLRSSYVRWFAGARMTRSYRKRILARLMLKSLRVNLLRDAPPVCDRYFTALEDFGITRQGGLPRLQVIPGAGERAREMLSARGADGQGRIIAVAPGASYATKRWPPSRFAEAAAGIAGPRETVVLLGSEGERETAGVVAQELESRGIRAVDLAGQTSLAESVAVMAEASILLTNDSGLMHVADALGKPLVAVFGPTSRELGFYPLGPRARVVEIEELECRPCTLHGDSKCPRSHHRCMEDLPVERVVDAARNAMAGPDRKEADGSGAREEKPAARAR